MIRKCLDRALRAAPAAGVWGGTGEEERRSAARRIRGAEPGPRSGRLPLSLTVRAHSLPCTGGAATMWAGVCTWRAAVPSEEVPVGRVMGGHAARRRSRRARRRAAPRP
ncbi:WhiB family transcriptional regulator [Streptomyces sp. GC420]|uniref:WhiB family transcriptional regulator n=1 Tax=Streptomyces sp. GC420 TaxID=2697568 RepID=UPI0028BD3F32|nr:WhiB family transcriptional regulator [Streptomyces sp. GC420]